MFLNSGHLKHLLWRPHKEVSQSTDINNADDTASREGSDQTDHFGTVRSGTALLAIYP